MELTRTHCSLSLNVLLGFCSYFRTSKSSFLRSSDNCRRFFHIRCSSTIKFHIYRTWIIIKRLLLLSVKWSYSSKTYCNEETTSLYRYGIQTNSRISIFSIRFHYYCIETTRHEHDWILVSRYSRSQDFSFDHVVCFFSFSNIFEINLFCSENGQEVSC